MTFKLRKHNLTFIVFILLLPQISISSAEKDSQENKTYVIFHLKDIDIHEDDSKGSAEVYLKIKINEEDAIETPVVKGVNNGAKINYDWNLSLGESSESYIINIEIKDQVPSLLPDSTIDTISLQSQDVNTDLLFSQTEDKKATITWEYFTVLSNEIPNDSTPPPFLISPGSSSDIGGTILVMLAIFTAIIGLLAYIRPRQGGGMDIK